MADTFRIVTPTDTLGWLHDRGSYLLRPLPSRREPEHDNYAITLRSRVRFLHEKVDRAGQKFKEVIAQ